MSDFVWPVLFLIGLGCCVSAAISDDKDRQRCAPVCAPHTYAKTTLHGECVCNINQIIVK